MLYLVAFLADRVSVSLCFKIKAAYTNEFSRVLSCFSSYTLGGQGL